MRIPKFIKQIIKFADPTDCRYALGGVKCEHTSGVSTLCATDGRALTQVSFKDDDAESDIDAVVDGAPLAKAFTAVKHSKSSKMAVTLEVDGDVAHIHGDGDATASVNDGRFPRYRDLFVGKNVDGPHTAVRLDPTLLKAVAELYAAVPNLKPHVDMYVPHDTSCPVLFAATSSDGEIVRTLVCPMVLENVGAKQPPFPSEASAPYVKPASTEPAEPECTRPDDESVYQADDEWTGVEEVEDAPAVEQPAPPPECVDDDTLAPTFSDLPTAGAMPAGW